jgi:hypothetical protein
MPPEPSGRMPDPRSRHPPSPAPASGRAAVAGLANARRRGGALLPFSSFARVFPREPTKNEVHKGNAQGPMTKLLKNVHAPSPKFDVTRFLSRLAKLASAAVEQFTARHFFMRAPADPVLVDKSVACPVAGSGPASASPTGRRSPAPWPHGPPGGGATPAPAPPCPG